MGYSTMDDQGLMKIVSIMNFLQDTASEHAGYLGVSGFDLARHDFTWVIHRYQIEIHAHPSGWTQYPSTPTGIPLKISMKFAR